MFKPTINDYRHFLVQFQQDNPQLEQRRFGLDDPSNNHNIDPNDSTLLQDALIEENWEERLDYWEEVGQHWKDNDSYLAYVSGRLVGNRYSYDASEAILLSQIEEVRAFTMITSDEQIAYLVLALKNGTFRLGEYIGD